MERDGDVPCVPVSGGAGGAGVGFGFHAGMGAGAGMGAFPLPETGISVGNGGGGAAAAAVALLGGGNLGFDARMLRVNGYARDGAPAPARRSFDSAFDGAVLLGGMSTLGLQHPRILEGAATPPTGPGRGPHGFAGAGFAPPQRHSIDGGAHGASANPPPFWGTNAAPSENALHALLGGGEGAGVVAAGAGVVAAGAGVVATGGVSAGGRTAPFHAAMMHAPLRGYPGLNGATGRAPGTNPGGFRVGGRAGATSASGVAVGASGAAPAFAPPDAFGAAPPPSTDLARVQVHAGAGSPFKGGGDGMGPRISSFQHLGMIEGVLGEESSFFGA